MLSSRSQKKLFKARTVVFTWYPSSEEPEVDDYLDLHNVLTKGCSASWYLYGKEICPTTDRTHYQGMAFTHAHSAWTALRNRCHVEACKEPYASVKYCSKDGKTTEWGEKPKWRRPNITNSELLNSDLNQLVDSEQIPLKGLKKLKEDISAYRMSRPPKDAPEVRGIWISGDPGVGKSHYVRNLELNLYTKAQNKWWCGFTGHTAVLLDDMDQQGKCLSHFIKIWADKWSNLAEQKFGATPLDYERFYVTSNYRISEIWPFQEDPALFRAISRRFAEYEIVMNSQGDRTLVNLATGEETHI